MSSKKKASKATPKGTSDTRLSRGRTRPGAIFPVAPATASLPLSYTSTLQQIKTHLATARVRAILAANPVVIEAYWQTRKIILARQQEVGWGAKVIDRLAADLQAEFPDMSGLTARNLLSMKIFAREFPEGPIAKQAVSQLPWGQIIRLMQMVKEPYLFDFLGTADPRREAEVERALVDHIQKFLLELGTGFAFVGRQVRLEVGEEDYPLDLLFYHLKLRRYVVIELKARAFTPCDVGQLNLYLSAVDDLLRHPDDQPTIGLLLCRKKNKLVAEYALRGLDQSIAVAEWQTRLTDTLPDDLRGSLPTIEEIEAELAGDLTGEAEEGSHTKPRRRRRYGMSPKIKPLRAFVSSCETKKEEAKPALVPVWGDAPGRYQAGPLALQDQTCTSSRRVARFLRADGATSYQPGASPQVHGQRTPEG